MRHPLTAAVGFTGSYLAGRSLFDAAAQRPRPIASLRRNEQLSQRSRLPFGRGPPASAGPGSWPKDWKNSFTLGVGQLVCTRSPGLIFGADGRRAWNSFASALTEQAKTVAPGVMLHAAIASAFRRAESRD